MAEKRNKSLGTQGYKFTLLDRLVYFASLKRTMITLVVFLLFSINYNTFHLSTDETLLASVPNEIWAFFAVGFTAVYDMFIAFGVLEHKGKGKYDGSGLMTKEDYIMRVRPKIYYMPVMKKVAIFSAFFVAAFLVLFNGVSRVDFTADRIERYNAFGIMTESCSYEEINRGEVYCAWHGSGKHSSVRLYIDVVLPDGEIVKVDTFGDTIGNIHSLYAIKEKLTNAQVAVNEYQPVEEHIEWYGDYTEEEIRMVYELFGK